MTSLPDIEHTHEQLLEWIGNHADIGTAHILNHTLKTATESDVARVQESILQAKPDDRAAWLIAALKSEREQRIGSINSDSRHRGQGVHRNG